MDARDKVVENIAHQTMDSNAEIIDAKIIDIEYIYEYECKVDLGGAGRGSRQTTKTESWSISENHMDYLLHSVSDITEWTNENRMEYRKTLLEEYKDVTCDLYLKPTIQYKISYHGSDKTTVAHQTKTLDTDFYDILLDKKHIRVDSETESSITIRKNESETITLSKEVQTTDQYSYKHTGFLLEYLSIDNWWVKARIRDINSTDEKISISIAINNEQTTITFTEPFTDDNQIYKLLDMYSYTDPMQLESEYIYVSFSPYKPKNVRKDRFCVGGKIKLTKEQPPKTVPGAIYKYITGFYNRFL